MTTTLETIREDQALGAAWRRCEAALPEGWRMGGVIQRGARDNQWQGVVLRGDGAGQSVQFGRGIGDIQTIEGPRCPTPTAALEALAERLEALR